MSFTLPTKTQIIAKFARKYPTAGASWGADLFDQAYNWVCDRIDIRSSSVDISLVAGTRQYTLGNALLRVERVEYWSNSSTCYPLHSVKRGDINLTGEDWINLEGTPARYMLESVVDTGNLAKPVLVLAESPTISTSGGYPKLVVYGQFIDSIAGSDTIPSILRDETPILHKMYALYALEQDEGKFQLLDRVATNTMTEALHRAKMLQKESPELFSINPLFHGRRR